MLTLTQLSVIYGCTAPRSFCFQDFSHDAPHASEIRLTSGVIHSASLSINLTIGEEAKYFIVH